MSSDREVISEFRSRLSKAKARHLELISAVCNKPSKAALETFLVEQFVVSLAVEWEAFIHDLLVTYALMSPLTTMRGLSGRIISSIKDKFGEAAVKAVRLSFPKNITRQGITRLMDSKGWNLSAENASALSGLANKWLVARYAKKFSLNADDSQFLSYLIAIRNYLSHRSQGSLSILRDMVRQMTAPQNAAFVGRFKSVGAHLRSPDNNGRTRAVQISERLDSLAGKL
jgi:hypothetical protein